MLTSTCSERQETEKADAFMIRAAHYRTKAAEYEYQSMKQKAAGSKLLRGSNVNRLPPVIVQTKLSQSFIDGQPWPTADGEKIDREGENARHDHEDTDEEAEGMQETDGAVEAFQMPIINHDSAIAEPDETSGDLKHEGSSQISGKPSSSRSSEAADRILPSSQGISSVSSPHSAREERDDNTTAGVLPRSAHSVALHNSKSPDVEDDIDQRHDSNDKTSAAVHEKGKTWSQLNDR